ncbi:MAG: cytochrome c [candidate division KSB1 bacterium]|nr:cytochrome c [candidate division KSB1 bacterium]MDZ7300706.1 cytochrome c [candidate division KSB1 bacterium]MDZ7310024.1 cytochrome c [candidate division KSB1 bacterium]
MSVKVLNIFLLIFLAFMMVVIFFARRDYTTRNLELLPGMVTSVAYRPQAPMPDHPREKAFPPIVDATVARGFEPLPYKPTPEDALRAGLELKSPLNPSDSTADLARGASIFATICSPCHGANGAGDGVIAQRGFPPPPSLVAENAMKMKEGQIFHLITYGQRNMPSLASQVRREDRWRVVKFIRSVQKKVEPARGASR